MCWVEVGAPCQFVYIQGLGKMAQGGGPHSVLCRYFMSNVCNKGDQCRFSHDPSVSQPSMVCRYFLKGTCAYGDKCRYEHQWPEYVGKVGEGDSSASSSSPLSATTTIATIDTDTKQKKLPLENDTLSSHQPNMINISSTIGLSGAPVYTRVTSVPPPATAAAAPPALLQHPQAPHLQPHPATPHPIGFTNAQEMIKLVATSMNQFVAMILDAHRVPHMLPAFKNKRTMTVEDARNSAQNLLTYVLKLGAALYRCMGATVVDPYMELFNLLLRFWTEAKEPCPELNFSFHDLHQMSLHPEGRHLLETTLNQLQYYAATLKSILHQQ